MKVISGYMPMGSMPVEEIQKHIDSYHFFGHEVIFFQT